MAKTLAELEPDLKAALAQVKEPMGRSVLEAGIVVGIGTTPQGLVIQCRAGQGWPEPIRQRIERDIKAAVGAMVPAAEVVVDWDVAPAAEHGHGHSHSHATPASGGAPEPPKIKRIIAVGSGKGGVGKSTIAASLAYALTHKGHRVGLMDADVYGPSIPHMLGLVGSQPTVANGKYQPPEVDGIKVMSMGFLVPPEQAVVWRGPMLHKAVRDFLYLVEWGELDDLVVDLPPGTGDVVLSLSQQMPIAGAVIVCTPQDVALLDARKAVNMFHTVKIPIRGLVENMSFFVCPDTGKRYDIFGHGGAERWAKDQGIPFLGAVPINISMRINGDEGRVGDNFAAGSPGRDDLSSLADRLLEQLAGAPAPKAPLLDVV